MRQPDNSWVKKDSWSLLQCLIKNTNCSTIQNSCFYKANYNNIENDTSIQAMKEWHRSALSPCCCWHCVQLFFHFPTEKQSHQQVLKQQLFHGLLQQCAVIIPLHVPWLSAIPVLQKSWLVAFIESPNIRFWTTFFLNISYCWVNSNF